MELLIIAFLIFLNGLFVAAEFSLVRVRALASSSWWTRGVAAQSA